jgi:hypothetical protein
MAKSADQNVKRQFGAFGLLTAPAMSLDLQGKDQDPYIDIYVFKAK